MAAYIPFASDYTLNMFTTFTTLALAASVSAIPATVFPRIPAFYNSTTNGTANGTSEAYELIADYSGNTFFDHFTAFSGPDPTHVHVQYQTLAAAADQKLVGFIYNASSGNSTAYIGVDSNSQAPNGRNSVRLTSKQTFNAGSMAVIDVRHAPSQFGVWPAIWLLGSKGTWPASGESDILEYVHEDDHNGMTLHTSPGCTVSNISSTYQQGRLLSNDCNKGNAVTGCSVAAYDQSHLAGNSSTSKTNTFATTGKAFNTQSGGVYVHDWQADGITVWIFPRDHLPADLLAGHPQPSTWKQTPLAKFSGSGCDFSNAFKSMQLTINIDFCGDWAGKVWESSGAANETGVSTCAEYVEKNPEVFEESYFEIGGVQFYTSNGQRAGEGPTFSKRDGEKEEVVTIQNATRPHCQEEEEAWENMTTATTFAPTFNATLSVPRKCSNGIARLQSGNLTRRGMNLGRFSGRMSSAAPTMEVAGWLFAAALFVGYAFVA